MGGSCSPKDAVPPCYMSSPIPQLYIIVKCNPPGQPPLASQRCTGCREPGALADRSVHPEPGMNQPTARQTLHQGKSPQCRRDTLPLEPHCKTPGKVNCANKQLWIAIISTIPGHIAVGWLGHLHSIAESALFTKNSAPRNNGIEVCCEA